MPRILLDTNIIISALIFGGNPRRIFKWALSKNIIAVTSLPLLAELSDILTKKFDFSRDKIKFLGEKIKQDFFLVYPKHEISILKDIPDNRVLEAAEAGGCDYIVTGDKELLALKKFKNIAIVTPQALVVMLSD